MKKYFLVLVAATALGLSCSCFGAQGGSRGMIFLPAFARNQRNCDWWPTLCADVWNHKNYQGYYTGHDEPALGFYSTTPGSGNNVTFLVTLPTEPLDPVAQDGRGGTDDFQLRPTFQFFMALCDTQSAPEYTHTVFPTVTRTSLIVPAQRRRNTSVTIRGRQHWNFSFILQAGRIRAAIQRCGAPR
jgi:hypothetical protein